MDVTVYTTSGDLSMWVAIFNGIAMLCQKTTLIYSLATMVATYHVLVMATRASLTGGSGLGSVAAAGSTSIFTPFLVAILLTTGSLQGSVTIESTLTGAMSKVDNVPIALSIIQGASSEFAHEVGNAVEVAFQGTGTNYAAISDSGQGFLNPMRTLLSARAAVTRLGGIDSEINTLVAACITADIGPDYAQIRNLVMNAGNTGAGGSQSFQVSNATNMPTAIGALLYAAASNPYGKVLDLRPNDPQILSCNDAANLVANNINTALNSPEFARVVQGAISSADTPNANACTTYACLQSAYDATISSSSNSMVDAIAGGASASAAELINLLFSETVANQLECIRADGVNKSMCLADMIQRNSIEQNNLQEAANANQMAQTWGQYADMMFALVSGLGPVVFLLMMFAGALSWPAAKRLAQFIIFPQLVILVGSVIINGIMYMKIAEFFRAYRQGGLISQAMALEAYKRLSLAIGTASSLMSSLPAMLAALFGFMAVSGFWRTPGTGPAANHGKEVADVVSPTLTNSTPIVRAESQASGTILPDGTSVVKGAGALPMVSSNANFGSMAHEQSDALASVAQRSQSISEGRTEMASWQEAFRKGDYSKLGIDNVTGEAIHQNYLKQQSYANNQSEGVKNSDSAANTNSSEVSASGELNASFAEGWGAGAGLGVKTATSATDSKSNDRYSGDDRSLSESRQLSKAIDDFQNTTRSHSVGTETSHSLEHARSVQQSYQTSLSESKSNSQEQRDLVRNGESFVVASADIKEDVLARHALENRNYGRFQTIEGVNLERNAGMSSFMNKAREEMASGAFHAVVGNDRAANAVVRHRAAVLAYEQGNDEQKTAALKYLVNEGNALTGQRFQPQNPQYKAYDIAGPNNRVNSGDVQGRANSTADSGTQKPLATVRAFPDSYQPPVSTSDAQRLKTHVVTDLNLGADSVRQQVKHDQQIATGHGIGDDRSGTIGRTGKNVAKNAEDVVDGVKNLFKRNDK